MGTLKMILTVVFVIISIALIILVLLQEGKSAGLGAISGAAETYWGRNKGRSMEGTLEKLTKVFAVGFIVIAIALIPITSKSNASTAETTDTTQQTEDSGTQVADSLTGSAVTTQSVVQ